MKYIRLLLLMILLLPVMVFAKDECDNSKIQIKSIEVSDKSMLVEELSPPTTDGLKLGIDVSLSKVGDSITYKMEIENTSNSDYLIKEEDIVSNSEYINYEVTYSDDSNVIKGKSSKDVYLRVSYDTEVPSDKLDNGILKDNQKVNVALLSEKRKDNILKNPETGTIFFLSFVIIMSVLFLIFSKKQKNIKYVLLLGIMFIPIITKAVCAFPVVIDSNVTIDTRSTTFKTGDEVNIQMKKLANPEVDPTSITVSYQDNNILYFKKSATLPTGLTEENVVSTSDSETPIYMWFDTDTIYYYTDAKLIYLNENASGMFRNLRKVLTVEGLNRVDTSRTTNLSVFFNWCIELQSLDPLENWDTSNVIDINHMFTNCRNITNLDGLTNWNVSNVENIESIFARCWKIKNVNGLKNWDISKITSLYWVFFDNKELSDISGLSNWNVSNVEDLSDIFGTCESLKDLSPLSNWDVSKAINKSSIFSRCKTIEDLSPLSNWNMSKTENMKNMFYECSSLKNLNAISNWDVSNVKDMSGLFFGCIGLEDANGINDWDITNVTKFDYMFSYLSAPQNYLIPNHPNFTKRPGTWSNNGTFVPDN